MHLFHYWFVLRTSSSLHPFHYWFVPRTSSGLHHPLPQDGILPSRSSPAVLPAERANFDSEEAPALATS